MKPNIIFLLGFIFFIICDFQEKLNIKPYMKSIFALLFLLFYSFQLIAQQKPIISAGAGFSLFNDNNDPNMPYLLGFNVQIEKPFDFFAEKPVFMSVRPGLNYNKVGESYQSEALGNWYEYRSDNKALSLNSKILAGTELKKNTNLKVYGGLNFGVYLWSETKKSLNQKNESTLDGNIFFNSWYSGFLFGVGPKISDSKIVPAFEFSFFPNFANTGETKRNAFQISFIIGINKIKIPD